MFDLLHDRDADSDSDSGYGRERDDDPPRGSSSFPMTRRDEIERLHDQTLRDTRAFLARREGRSGKKSSSVGGEIISLGALAAGAASSAYLSQRFRNAGGVVPLGVLLGGIGYAGAHFGVFGAAGDQVKNASIGAALASLAIWAAGYGSLAAERAASQAPATGASAGLGLASAPVPAISASSAWPPSPSPGFAPPGALAGAPMTQADFMNLILAGRRAA